MSHVENVERPCSKVNCVCERMDGWPQRTSIGWTHLHAEQPRFLDAAPVSVVEETNP